MLSDTDITIELSENQSSRLSRESKGWVPCLAVTDDAIEVDEKAFHAGRKSHLFLLGGFEESPTEEPWL